MAVAALAVGAAAVSAYGAYSQAQAQKQAAEYQAEVGEQNARIQERNARDVEARGLEEQDRYRRKLGQMLGSQRAQLAGTGVDLSGSALDLMADTAGEGARDVATIGQNTARSAYETRIGAMSSRQQANMSKATASGISPWLSAGTSALNSAAGMAASGMFSGTPAPAAGPGNAGNAGGTLMGNSTQFSPRWYTYDRMQAGRGA